MRKLTLVLLVAALAASFASVREAQAQSGNIVVHRTSTVGFGNGGFGGYGGFGNPWAWGPSVQTLGYIPTPPYFALHPPVYYSHNVRRPYGVSPFPITSYSPSSSVVYERPTPEPQVVVNPYVEQDITSEPVSPSQVPVLKVIDSAGKDVSVPTPSIVINDF